VSSRAPPPDDAAPRDLTRGRRLGLRLGLRVDASLLPVRSGFVGLTPPLPPERPRRDLGQRIGASPTAPDAPRGRCVAPRVTRIPATRVSSQRRSPRSNHQAHRPARPTAPHPLGFVRSIRLARRRRRSLGLLRTTPGAYRRAAAVAFHSESSRLAPERGGASRRCPEMRAAHRGASCRWRARRGSVELNPPGRGGGTDDADRRVRDVLVEHEARLDRSAPDRAAAQSARRDATGASAPAATPCPGDSGSRRSALPSAPSLRPKPGWAVLSDASPERASTTRCRRGARSLALLVRVVRRGRCA